MSSDGCIESWNLNHHDKQNIAQAGKSDEEKQMIHLSEDYGGYGNRPQNTTGRI